MPRRTAGTIKGSPMPHSGQEQPLPLTPGVSVCPPSCSKLGETRDLCCCVTKVVLSRSCCCR